MAAQTSRLIRRAGRVALWALAALASLLTVFLLAAWIGSSLPRNPDWTQTDRGIEIMVETNGVHTAIVMPLVTPQKDWRAEFPAAHLGNPAREYSHVSVSWGEREVFLNTPTWADLSPLTVARVIGIGGDGLLHVAHYVRPAPADDIRILRLTSDEYSRLVRRIEVNLPEADTAHHPGYTDQDVFYDASGSYTVTNTCNQWTSDTLAEAGVRIGRWTPLAGGVMKWIEAPAKLDKSGA